MRELWWKIKWHLFTRHGIVIGSYMYTICRPNVYFWWLLWLSAKPEIVSNSWPENIKTKVDWKYIFQVKKFLWWQHYWRSEVHKLPLSAGVIRNTRYFRRYLASNIAYDIIKSDILDRIFKIRLSIMEISLRVKLYPLNLLPKNGCKNRYR